ncbi:hypothetical protein HELRODRAFT_172889 [Helobdella robusta]|uniref:Alpha-2-macroglobulin bait region domain-containing protein n=1 Tax=Helobdella robusta TaxID=6412 RepID=T1F629_HELRO|nr:hypothetical protein HELRODRAFT_172889 [Helobdella robusta]ESO03865.1 hypothetical protein HELRODRAFT_172889 [Helobdella robusta]
MTHITDKNDNLIVQKINPGLHKGVYSGELQLSKVTPLGFWKINVETKEEAHSETIEVAEYVLPKYEVKVELPKSYLVYESGYNDDVQNISSKQEDLRATVTAKYTYGEPVKGVALISFKLRAVRYKKSDHIPSINKMIQLTDGKADVSVSYKDLLNLFPCSDSFNRLLYQTIEVEAFITEQLKLSHNELPNPMLKDLKYFNGTFKKIPVSVTFHVRNYSSSLEKSYMTEFNELGEAVISLDIDKNIKSLSLNAKYKDDVLDTFLYASHYASEFANRDRKFLQLSAKVLDDVLKPDKNTTFIVRTTEPIKYFFYQILSKGFISQAKVVKSDKASSLHEFTIVPSKQLALELAPRVKILAYYVNTKDEVVADAMTVNVEDYLVNKLSIAFDKNSTSPSKPIVLNVEAEKDSFVGIAAVDKSVLLLHAPTQLSKLKYMLDYTLNPCRTIIR